MLLERTCVLVTFLTAESEYPTTQLEEERCSQLTVSEGPVMVVWLPGGGDRREAAGGRQKAASSEVASHQQPRFCACVPAGLLVPWTVRRTAR